ncbi:hypothetical protein ABZ712_27015 [Streptomyces sp. NPDC006906]|uniref:hypothetical protein n=1 Tax=Streptomyces sp. NPDC006906 TaxID=3154782 RepID=UPI0033C3CF60
MKALGGIVLEPKWLGSLERHRVQCGAGHNCNPRPAAVQQGQSLCRTCAGNDPVAAEREFRERVAELGGIVLEPKWRGSGVPHRVQCASGHNCDPIPGNIKFGTGLCRKCAGLAWDVFYVLINEDAGTVKFGITSGSPRPRLAVHARDGYQLVVRLLTGLPDDVALSLERAARTELLDAGHVPVRGREYFSASLVQFVLDTVDHHPR